jgi:hypothetical protein
MVNDVSGWGSLYPALIDSHFHDVAGQDLRAEC